jgi:GSCFA family
MSNPYKSLPDTAFWHRSVSNLAPGDVDPVSPPKFKLGLYDRIATAGSCFAQHIARALKEKGFKYLETETGPLGRGYGVFSARFGNLYTTRQLLQLFQRSYGLLHPVDEVWTLDDGRFVDPFRPQVEPGGYATAAEVIADRQTHLAAVQSMFENCDVFIFTLGLTECWRSTRDGAVFPLAPGVAGSPAAMADYEFHNFTAAETTTDLLCFIKHLRLVNPQVRLIFTVSPVPLVATYEPQHVLLSTIYSKSVLRVAAEEVVRETEMSSYYPSYEIVTGHHTRHMYFADDLRSVTNEGVDRAMSLFSRHYLSEKCEASLEESSQSVITETKTTVTNQKDDELYHIICDEEVLDT